jgi:hypothetical protein
MARMIKVIYGNNVSKEEDIVEAATVIFNFCTSHNIDLSSGEMHLNGAALLPGDINKTFADFGVTETCYLLNVAKGDNGTD